MKGFLTSILLLAISCSTQEPRSDSVVIMIPGRDQNLIYQALIPSHWDYSFSSNSHDTMIPICELAIKENDEKIEITIHNFPTEEISEQVPPSAQVARWQNQQKNPSSICIDPEHHGGFCGLRLELETEKMGLIAWSMTISPVHYQALTRFPDSTSDKQRRADYTIKIVGPKDLIQRHREDLIAFANSFELIEEIPEWP